MATNLSPEDVIDTVLAALQRLSERLWAEQEALQGPDRFETLCRAQGVDQASGEACKAIARLLSQQGPFSEDEGNPQRSGGAAARREGTVGD